MVLAPQGYISDQAMGTYFVSEVHPSFSLEENLDSIEMMLLSGQHQRRIVTLREKSQSETGALVCMSVPDLGG